MGDCDCGDCGNCGDCGDCGDCNNCECCDCMWEDLNCCPKNLICCKLEDGALKCHCLESIPEELTPFQKTLHFCCECFEVID